MEELFQVGAVTSTHGLRGEVKVFPTTDEPGRYKKLKEVIVDTGKGRETLKIEHVRFFKQMVIVKFAEYGNINEVEKYKGARLYVKREQALALREDEYYYADLAGLCVQTEEGETLGTLKDILQTGANDVYVVGRGKKKDLLVPAIKDCIKKVDLEHRTMTVHLLPGLLEASEGGAG
ncbi:MAG: ribosome maturation factor RimM [Eubacterium sp.]|nr:ribosome maturation factor RimM [Eubacterium sp.]